MSTPTIETVAPSSTSSTNAPSPTPAPETPPSSSAAPVNEPASSTSAFGAALQHAAGAADGVVTPPEKPADKPEDKAKDKPAEKLVEKDKAAPALDELPKLGAKDLLKKDEPKTKDDKAKGKDGKPVEDEPLSEEELKEELDNPHRKEKSQRRYRQLWEMRKKAEEIVATTAKQVKEREEEIAKLKEQMKTAGDKAGIPDDVQKQLEELAMLKREKGLHDDPQIKQLFDNRVANAETVIMDILTKRQSPLPKSYVDAIAQAGGFIGFSKIYPQEAEQIFELLPLAERKEIESAMAEQMILGRQKNAYIEGEKSKAVQYFADQKARQEAEAAAKPDPKKEAEAMQQRFTSWREGVKKEAKDIFGEQEIPADASETVKKEITEKNRFARQLSAALDQRVGAKTPEEWQDILLESVLAHKLSADNKSLRSENELLKAELETVRGAGKTTTRNGGINPLTPPKTADEKPKPFGEAFLEALEKANSAI